MMLWLQNSVLIQPRTSPLKFDDLAGRKVRYRTFQLRSISQSDVQRCIVAGSVPTGMLVFVLPKSPALTAAEDGELAARRKEEARMDAQLLELRMMQDQELLRKEKQARKEREQRGEGAGRPKGAVLSNRMIPT